MKLNHHSATVLPFHVDERGVFHGIFERKSADYRPPFFDNALNFIGGNSQVGDASPRAVKTRELEEEFWQIYEPEESLNKMLGQEFINEKPHVVAVYDPAAIRTLQHLGDLLHKDAQHAGDYFVRTVSPITKGELIYAGTVFVKQLQTPEFREARDIIVNEFVGRVTTDNVRRGSLTEVLSRDEINLGNRKFSWGYDIVTNQLMRTGVIPQQEYGVLRSMAVLVDDLESKPIAPIEVVWTPGGERGFSDFVAMGHTYKDM
jgi:hypothetical protein